MRKQKKKLLTPRQKQKIFRENVRDVMLIIFAFIYLLGVLYIFSIIALFV